MLSSKCLELSPELQAFTVRTPSGVHAVTLFLKQKCTCPAAGACSHILAAQYAIGMTEADQKKRVLNLTKLRQNTRKRVDKKSGKKRPRKLDVDVTAAPDAEVEQENHDDSVVLARKTFTTTDEDSHPQTTQTDRSNLCSDLELPIECPSDDTVTPKPTKKLLLAAPKHAKRARDDLAADDTSDITFICEEQPVNKPTKKLLLEVPQRVKQAPDLRPPQHTTMDSETATECLESEIQRTKIQLQQVINNFAVNTPECPVSSSAESEDHRHSKSWEESVCKLAHEASERTGRRKVTASTVGSINLTVSDMKLMQPPNWLNDKVSNCICRSFMTHCL